MAEERSLKERCFFYNKAVSMYSSETIRVTYIVFLYESEESGEGAGKVGTKSICKGSDNVTRRGN